MIWFRIHPSGGPEAAMNDHEHDPHAASEPTRYTRRLSDKILIAFHHACDQGDNEVAAQLLDVLEFMINRAPHLPDGRDRRTKESLVAAHERLWLLRHPAFSGC
jgi:hypothetical protein